MMINPDQNNNKELINFMKNIFEGNNENEEDKNIKKKKNDNKSLDNSIRANKNINNKRKEKEISNKIKKRSINIIERDNSHNIIERDDPHKELRTIEVENPINNMIALNSGNIALSVKKTILIYNASILNLPYEGNCLIQKIYIKGKSKVR